MRRHYFLLQENIGVQYETIQTFHHEILLFFCKQMHKSKCVMTDIFCKQKIIQHGSIYLLYYIILLHMISHKLRQYDSLIMNGHDLC